MGASTTTAAPAAWWASLARRGVVAWNEVRRVRPSPAHAPDLRGADLRGLSFVGFNFAGSEFTGADLTDATFTRCNVSGSAFSRLADVTFDDCDTRGAFATSAPAEDAFARMAARAELADTLAHALPRRRLYGHGAGLCSCGTLAAWDASEGPPSVCAFDAGTLDRTGCGDPIDPKRLDTTREGLRRYSARLAFRVAFDADGLPYVGPSLFAGDDRLVVVTFRAELADLVGSARVAIIDGAAPARWRELAGRMVAVVRETGELEGRAVAAAEDAQAAGAAVLMMDAPERPTFASLDEATQTATFLEWGALA